MQKFNIPRNLLLKYSGKKRFNFISQSDKILLSINKSHGRKNEKKKQQKKTKITFHRYLNIIKKLNFIEKCTLISDY